ncbi:tRNA 5-methylaminomethyl-2-thiouridine biosynthesis bifunctional protein MnmC [Planctomycetes bacterium CA13]|uniref:tRNA 5-methylaminomethyl-2-thiouridine biosynthesis bifunctional protein MnmC n=1 Tax=Novipirellula herctigrandis TaxID=2527986 RepID=A0A5C5YWE3_9BACT|nr:tRNA 5-methylaminomethyl-2-thiouridine biosynthesis bifunctional protein MnmC [Planctomycetes bacterium CA13]
MPNSYQRPTMPSARESLSIQVTDDHSRTLIKHDTGDSYHSGSGAISETRHVYLNNSGAQQRLAVGQPTRVLEIGLGTAMAMLLTLDQAVRYDTPLDYVAIELDLLSAEVIESLQPKSWIENSELAEQFLEWRRKCDNPALPSVHVWCPSEKHRVEVVLDDACGWHDLERTFDTIYFDPFAPESNPELWTHAVLERMFTMLQQGGSLVTYCVKRAVRDRLAAIGFDVSKVPGPEKGKREVLIATKPPGGYNHLQTRS